MKRRISLLLLLPVLLIQLTQAQKVITPKEHFGFNIGDDYCLATYTQTEAYFKLLDASSDRVKLIDIGLTEEGRTQYMLIISSPANIRNLDRYKTISQTLARGARGLDDTRARELAEEGKAVVWIDGGLHATETVGTHQLIETAYQLATRNDRETLSILDNVIVLLAHANPDGQELVSSTYMSEADPARRRTNIPFLYQKYAGHDNNRDFYMLALRESRNISRQLYIEWNPQILYNHHQSGPAGTIVAGPPFRDPHNYVYDPLVMTSLDAVGAAMVNRLISENKPGYTQKGGSQFSTWYNGGLRTTGYYHNVIGLLTEIVGGPTPSQIPVVPDRLLSSSANPYPVETQDWTFRKSIDYSVSLNYAVLNYASRQRSDLLYNFYRMGRNSIEKGSSDYRTITPKVIESLKTASQPAGQGGRQGGGGRFTTEQYNAIMKDPAKRDARAYIIPADQEDFPTAVKFINAMIGSGIEIHKATAGFSLNGKNYPAGSYVVMCAQAFRPYVIDMFEPQDHPNDFQYPGGPPIAPYDAAGWTLAYQMGIKFDRVTDKPEGPFRALPVGVTESYPAQVLPAPVKAGYVFSPKTNNSFIVANELLNEGIKVYRLTAKDPVNPGPDPGTFYVPVSAKSTSLLAKYSSQYGVKAGSVDKAPASMERIMPGRIAIWDRYGGSMPSGWMRLIMEQFRFPYKLIFPQRIDAGNLKKEFDVIIFVSGAIPAARAAAQSPAMAGQQPAAPQSYDNTPAEYRHMMGNITADKSIPQLKKFLEDGGTIITIESSYNLAGHLGITVGNALVKTGDDGREINLSRNEYYIPGSILRASVNNGERAAWGMPEEADFNFDQSPVFKLPDNAAEMGIRVLAWFPDEKPLRSGWALGQEHLKGGVIGFEAPYGKGKLFVYGPDIAFRSQPHGLFKLMFNQLYIYSK